MKKLMFRLLKQGIGVKHGAPINIAFLDKADLAESNVKEEDALEMVARYVQGPVGINVFDLEAVTTTSDGILVDGAIVTMAAADGGKIHREFGVLHMAEVTVDDGLITEEGHLAPYKEQYSGRKLFRGPNPATKNIPVHNVVMTGRAVNNNSATEMMNSVTMEEILLPILGQIQIMKDGDILTGVTGEVISVGIGMTVAEKYGRVFPTRQFKAGETAHNSGVYAKSLKAHIPCFVAPKEVLAAYILKALEAGMIPGRHLGCSPAVLSAAFAYGASIDLANITPAAWAELESVGIKKKELEGVGPGLSAQRIIAEAERIIPGLENWQRFRSTDIVEKIYLRV